MATESPANGVSTTLAAAITNTATALSLTSATGFPNGQYTCLLSDGTNAELVEASALSGTTLTVARASEAWGGAATAYAFGIGTKVTIVTSVGSVSNLIATATLTLLNKRITKRVLTFATNAATYSVDTDNYDVVHITAQTVGITFSTTGAPLDGDMFTLSVTGTAAVTLAWGTMFEASTIALPTTTTGTARLDIGFKWNTETSKWRCLAVA